MVLLPVGAGLLVRANFPAAAERIGLPLGKVAEVLLYVLLVPVLIATSGLLLKMDLWSYLVIAVFIIVNLGMGLLLGPRDPKERTTLAMESGARNFGLAVTIAVLNFSQERALPVLIPYIIMFVLISTMFLKWRSRQTAG